MVEFKSMWFLVSQVFLSYNYWRTPTGLPEIFYQIILETLSTLLKRLIIINQSIRARTQFTKISHLTRTSINQPTFKCLGKKTCNYCKPKNPIMYTHKGPHLWSDLRGIKVLKHYYAIWRVSKLTVSCILTSKGYNSRLVCFSKVLVAAPRDL